MTLTLSSVGQMLKDFYPLPGSRIKQYVVDTYREDAWDDATCPRFNVDPHSDPDDADTCYVAGSVTWKQLGRSDCDVCNALYQRAATEPSVITWIAEKAKRPPIESDRTKLSDQIAPESPALRDHPMFAMLRKKPGNQVTE